jgi:L-seryl-tRNA(Ser) seleniumtransferase
MAHTSANFGDGDAVDPLRDGSLRPHEKPVDTIVNPEGLVKPDRRRELPSVTQLINKIEELRPELPLWADTEGARRVLAEMRERPGAETGDPPALDELARLAAQAAAALARTHPRRVINATGIVLHTNLGRAPLAPGAAQAVAAVAAGYSDLELDLGSGQRGQRTSALVEKLCLLSGAADALAVNNNAAAVWLVLATLAYGREVVVSRGELVEIGGSFRVPEILRSAGVRLVEVGTTNRTHPADYAAAIGPDTGLLLKVHRSNFSQEGFVAEVSLPELGEIGRAAGLPVVEDLGSGTLVDLSARGLPAEVYAPGRLAQGADLVCFSGDKLVGGPQAGIVLAGRSEPIAAMRKHPLARALRLDKLALAALDWTLTAHLDGRAEREVPVLRQLLTPPEELERRARALAERIAARTPSAKVAVAPDRAFAGGGSLPGFELATWVVEVRPAGSASRAAAALRRAAPPVLARVRDDAVVVDPRTLEPEDEAPLAEAFAALPD